MPRKDRVTRKVSLDDPDFMESGIIEQPTGPSTPQLLMGEAVLHLQGRQKQVYLSVMRDNKSLAETGEILGLGKSTVQVYLDRAIAFVSQYCKRAMDEGRV